MEPKLHLSMVLALPSHLKTLRGLNVKFDGASSTFNAASESCILAWNWQHHAEVQTWLARLEWVK